MRHLLNTRITRTRSSSRAPTSASRSSVPEARSARCGLLVASRRTTWGMPRPPYPVFAYVTLTDMIQLPSGLDSRNTRNVHPRRPGKHWPPWSALTGYRSERIGRSIGRGEDQCRSEQREISLISFKDDVRSGYWSQLRFFTLICCCPWVDNDTLLP